MKIKTPATFVLALAAFATLQGCAHTAYDQALDRKIDNEVVVSGRAGLRGEANRLIESAPDLSSDQRAKLLALRGSAEAEAERLRERSLQIRAVLVKELLAKNYHQDRVDLLKKKLKDVEQDRLSLFFRSVSRANEIFGRWGSRRAKSDMMMIEMNIYENWLL